MVRSAAKNHAFVTVIVDPSDYRQIVTETETTGAVSLETRRKLAVKAYRHTSTYDAAITEYLSRVYGV
jgi:phosphoribosylaminoimidazolecarboxamide formyltransferase/IMP cyclohydrolase